MSDAIRVTNAGHCTLLMHPWLTQSAIFPVELTMLTMPWWRKEYEGEKNFFWRWSHCASCAPKCTEKVNKKTLNYSFDTCKTKVKLQGCVTFKGTYKYSIVNALRDLVFIYINEDISENGRKLIKYLFLLSLSQPCKLFPSSNISQHPHRGPASGSVSAARPAES